MSISFCIFSCQLLLANNRKEICASCSSFSKDIHRRLKRLAFRRRTKQIGNYRYQTKEDLLERLRLQSRRLKIANRRVRIVKLTVKVKLIKNISLCNRYWLRLYCLTGAEEEPEKTRGKLWKTWPFKDWDAGNGRWQPYWSGKLNSPLNFT